MIAKALLRGIWCTAALVLTLSAEAYCTVCDLDGDAVGLTVAALRDDDVGQHYGLLRNDSGSQPERSPDSGENGVRQLPSSQHDSAEGP